MVKALNGDKATCPNDYSVAYFQALLAVLKDDVMNVFHEFHAQGKFERSLDTTFIALIPKKDER